MEYDEAQVEEELMPMARNGRETPSHQAGVEPTDATSGEAVEEPALAVNVEVAQEGTELLLWPWGERPGPSTSVEARPGTVSQGAKPTESEPRETRRKGKQGSGRRASDEATVRAGGRR
jgi:hypothetical protein